MASPLRMACFNLISAVAVIMLIVFISTASGDYWDSLLQSKGTRQFGQSMTKNRGAALSGSTDENQGDWQGFLMKLKDAQEKADNGQGSGW